MVMWLWLAPCTMALYYICICICVVARYVLYTSLKSWLYIIHVNVALCVITCICHPGVGACAHLHLLCATCDYFLQAACRDGQNIDKSAGHKFAAGSYIWHITSGSHKTLLRMLLTKWLSGGSSRLLVDRNAPAVSKTKSQRSSSIFTCRFCV